MFVLCLAAADALAALKPGDAAPRFQLPDRTGALHALSIVGEKNSRGVVVSFFATWCAPCREELPLMNAKADDLRRKGITIVLVDVKESFEEIDLLLAELKIDKPLVVSDRFGKALEAFGVRFLPTTFFIGPDGLIRDIIYGGMLDENDFMTGVKTLLK